jgi:hypothetical protein
MTGYYGITDAIRKAFNKAGRISTITHGDLNIVDLGRQSIYPLAHISPQGAVFDSNTTTYSFSLSVFDIIDFNKEHEDDDGEPFYGNDNVQDILHDISLTIEMALDDLRRGDMYSELYRIADSINGTSFISEGENNLAGWQIQMSVTTTNAAVNDGLC